jgi:hypothetical protein
MIRKKIKDKNQNWYKNQIKSDSKKWNWEKNKIYFNKKIND